MKTLRFVALALSMAIFAGCPAPQGPDNDTVYVKPIGGNVAVPGSQYDLFAAFTNVMPCGTNEPLVWSIAEQTVGWLPIDGSITQTGIWTSPGCGSVWMGQILHVQAKCVSRNTIATAAIATVPETVTGVQIAYAVKNPAGAACRYPLTPDGHNLVTNGSLCPNATQPCGRLADGTLDPANPSMCYCVAAGEAIQWYAKVVTTCGEVVTPAPPATWPATCP